MELVRWERRPELRRPLLMVAFEGWNDAGDASSLALEYLAQAWDAETWQVELAAGGLYQISRTGDGWLVEGMLD